MLPSELICATTQWPNGEVFVQDPWGRKVGIDACLVAEVVSLWNAGVRTKSCCCGHYDGPSYIEVEPECVAAMHDLYYVAYDDNPCKFYSHTSRHGHTARKRGRPIGSYDRAAAKARAAGEKYYEGKPCKECGGTKRYLSGHCVNYGEHSSAKKKRRSVSPWDL